MRFRSFRSLPAYAGRYDVCVRAHTSECVFTRLLHVISDSCARIVAAPVSCVFCAALDFQRFASILTYITYMCGRYVSTTDCVTPWSGECAVEFRRLQSKSTFRSEMAIFRIVAKRPEHSVRGRAARICMKLERRCFVISRWISHSRSVGFHSYLIGPHFEWHEKDLFSTVSSTKSVQRIWKKWQNRLKSVAQSHRLESKGQPASHATVPTDSTELIHFAMHTPLSAANFIFNWNRSKTDTYSIEFCFRKSVEAVRLPMR